MGEPENDAPGGFSDRRRYEVRWLLANLYTICYFGFVLLLFYIEPPASNKEVLHTVFVLLSSVQLTIINYYFGSSRDAEKAAEVAARALKEKP
jgi:hypothetical protein